jgi:outer membrane protein OmpA-like peptidoglycan-associated protein
MDQLVSTGISKNRLSFRGYGETKPVDSNYTPEGMVSTKE